MSRVLVAVIMLLTSGCDDAEPEPDPFTNPSPYGGGGPTEEEKDAEERLAKCKELVDCVVDYCDGASALSECLGYDECWYGEVADDIVGDALGVADECLASPNDSECSFRRSRCGEI